MNIASIREKVDKVLLNYQIARKQYKTEKETLVIAQQHAEDLKEAQIIIQQVAQIIQQKAHEKIEGVVSKCLEAVFGDKYGFKIRFERKRGRTEAILLLLKDGHEIENGQDADSGGVVDVAALALRLSCIVLSKPALKRIMILDEPFRNLDLQNRENIRILLEELAEDFKVQFIIVTHELAFKTGNIISI